MQRIPHAIPVTPVLGTATTIYTVPANVTATMSSLTASNVTGGAATLTLYVVPSGGTAGTGNTVIYQKSLAAGEVYPISALVGAHFSQGVIIQALSGTASAINIVGGTYETT